MTVPSIPLDRISGRARQVDARKALAWIVRLVGTVLVGVPYLIGWTLSKVWLGMTMLWVAAGEGWRDARRAKGGVRT
ncbi:hypothetical protein [Nonomuraea sp. NPDC049400]|uniref:hypothetical protein n=1 Tax=Nonomuraea sp. NPDC049400 TaxID=3364352 RepID=UPI0037B26103